MLKSTQHRIYHILELLHFVLYLWFWTEQYFRNWRSSCL